MKPSPATRPAENDGRERGRGRTRNEQKTSSATSGDGRGRGWGGGGGGGGGGSNSKHSGQPLIGDWLILEKKKTQKNTASLAHVRERRHTKERRKFPPDCSDYTIAHRPYKTRRQTPASLVRRDKYQRTRGQQRPRMTGLSVPSEGCKALGASVGQLSPPGCRERGMKHAPPPPRPRGREPKPPTQEAKQ